VTDKFQAAQCELFSFFNRDGEVDDAFVWICWIVFEGRNWFSGVFDKALLAVKLFKVFEEAFAYLLAVGDVAFIETDYCPDLRFREDRVAFNLELSKAIDLAFDDGDRDAQAFINRR